MVGNKSVLQILLEAQQVGLIFDRYTVVDLKVHPLSWSVNGRGWNIYYGCKSSPMINPRTTKRKADGSGSPSGHRRRYGRHRDSLTFRATATDPRVRAAFGKSMATLWYRHGAFAQSMQGQERNIPV